MYTETIKNTLIKVEKLTADIQLFFNGYDTGLIPSHIYPANRNVIVVDRVSECNPRVVPKEELQKRFNCI